METEEEKAEERNVGLLRRYSVSRRNFDARRSRRFLLRRRKKSTRALIMYSISLYVAEKHYEFFLLHTSYYFSLLLLFQRFFLTVALFSSKKFTQIVFVALDWIIPARRFLSAAMPIDWLGTHINIAFQETSAKYFVTLALLCFNVVSSELSRASNPKVINHRNRSSLSLH